MPAINPLIQAMLGSIVRFGLAFLAGYLIRAGIWTEGEAGEYVDFITQFIVMAIVLGGTALGWSVWQKYRNLLTLNTALATPHVMTQEQAKRLAASPAAPSSQTPPDVVPQSAIAFQPPPEG